MKHISIIVVPCCLAALTAFGCSPSASVPTPTAETSHSGAAASPTETVVDAGANADVGQGPIDDGGGDVGVLGGWQPATGDGASTAGPEAGGPPVQTITASIGQIQVDPNQEKVVCITLRLPNADPVYVARITVQLLKGHHLVTCRDAATTENLTPTACTTFQGILTGTGQPLMITEKPADDLTFPQGVALKIAAQQMIQLEGHYINTGTSTVQGTGTVNFETIPITTPNIIESDFAFWGTLNISIPPGTYSIGPIFAKGLSGTHGFALTTHQHRLGTDFKIWAANDATDTNHPPVAHTTDWANPPLYRLNPELNFDGQNGLAYQCTWNNTTGQTVTFGESANQEMCFLWMYYYPSMGFDFRFQ
jgi:copper type II ascorbate-dependent monooxygenase-like protein